MKHHYEFKNTLYEVYKALIYLIQGVFLNCVAQNILSAIQVKYDTENFFEGG